MLVTQKQREKEGDKLLPSRNNEKKRKEKKFPSRNSEIRRRRRKNLLPSRNNKASLPVPATAIAGDNCDLFLGKWRNIWKRRDAINTLGYNWNSYQGWLYFVLGSPVLQLSVVQIKRYLSNDCKNKTFFTFLWNWYFSCLKCLVIFQEYDLYLSKDWWKNKRASAGWFHKTESFCHFDYLYREAIL